MTGYQTATISVRAVFRRLASEETLQARRRDVQTGGHNSATASYRGTGPNVTRGGWLPTF
jgi:hypothetical protein